MNKADPEKKKDDTASAAGNIQFGDVSGNNNNISVGNTRTVINTGGGAYVGGNVNVGGGKFVGRDDYSQTGLSGDEIGRLFASIYQRIDARPADPNVPKADIKETVEVIEAQVKQGDNADERMLAASLKSLKYMAKDILEVVATTFADPKLGVALVIRKVMQKAKEQAA
jgi:hypothetical protein